VASRHSLNLCTLAHISKSQTTTLNLNSSYYPTISRGFAGRSVVQSVWLKDESFLNMYQAGKQKDAFWSSTRMIECKVSSNRTINKVAAMIMSALQKIIIFR